MEAKTERRLVETCANADNSTLTTQFIRFLFNGDGSTTEVRLLDSMVENCGLKQERKMHVGIRVRNRLLPLAANKRARCSYGTECQQGGQSQSQSLCKRA